MNTNKCISAAFLLAFAFIFISHLTVHAGPGDPDPTFGTGGQYTDNGSPNTCFGLFPRASVIQPDGKILVVGTIYDNCNYTYTNSPQPSRRLMIRRYLTDGTPEPGTNGTSGFGADGFGIPAIGSGVSIHGEAYDVRVLSDGTIVVSGLRYTFLGSAAVVWKFKSDGTLDTSYGSAGSVTFSASYGPAYAGAIEIYGGKLVVAMSVDDQTQVVVQRLLANGTIDSTFGPFGTAKVSTGIKPGWGFDVAVVARSGEVLVSGQAPNPNHGNIVEAVIAKYSSTGLVVMSFGASGRMFGSACTPNGGNVSTTPYVFDKLSLQSTGAILAHAASSFGGFAVVSTVFKFSSAGVRDAGFGPNLPCGFVMESSLAFARNDNDAFIFGYKRYSASGIVDNTYNASIYLNNSKFASVSPQDSKIVFTQSPFPDNGTLTMTRIMP